jgi:hypothetical protein
LTTISEVSGNTTNGPVNITVVENWEFFVLFYNKNCQIKVVLEFSPIKK